MSDKYSTDELITKLNIHFYPSPTGNSGDDYRLAIIARLRAADALISAVREESPLSVNVRKAIAGYEGKEE